MAYTSSADIYKKYPALFENNKVIICQSGWFNLISELCAAIQVYTEYDIIDKKSLHIVFQKFEQKHGVLNIEFRGGDEVAHHIIHYTERLSYKTCEICGNIGELYCSNKWQKWSHLKTLCKTHAISLFYYKFT